MSAEPIEPLDHQARELGDQDIEPDEDVSRLDKQMGVLMRRAFRRPLRIADLEDLDPAVGRVELIDGNPIVAPAPDFQHQDLCVELVVQLNGLIAVRGVTARAYTAVNVFQPGTDRTLFIPDVVVVDRSAIVQVPGQGEGVFPEGVLGVIEITSSNAETDLHLKRDRYLEWKVPYLVVNRQDEPHSYEVFGDWPDWAAPVLKRSPVQ